MNLKQFKSWKLLYEDESQCFSKAIYEIDQSPVFLITIFNPEALAIATKHMLNEHLYNFLGLIEDEGRIHLVLKAISGKSIKKVMRTMPLSYEERIELAYAYLKKIERYDVFPDAIKIQLLDEEQLLIAEESIAFRELIDFTLQTTYSTLEVMKQLGVILDIILYDANGYQNQFIDNLLRCKHGYSTLTEVKRHFKDVFIFEKPEALDKIDVEYTIILNDLDFGPPVHLDEIVNSSKPDVIKATLVDIPHDDLQSELAALLRQEVPIVSEPPAMDKLSLDGSKEEVFQPEVIQANVFEASVIEESVIEENVVNDSAVEDFVNTYDVIPDIHAEVIATPKPDSRTSDDKLPESLPKSSKSRAFDDEDLLDDDMSDLFDIEDLRHSKSMIFKPLLIVFTSILVLVVVYFGIQFFSSLSAPIKAQFEVEQLHDNRVAFMNTSEGKKKIQAYSWEIYYGDSLISTFEDENLFPLFDTNGTYTIVLKVMDKDQNWLEPYTFVYEFNKTK